MNSWKLSFSHPLYHIIGTLLKIIIIICNLLFLLAIAVNIDSFNPLQDRYNIINRSFQNPCLYNICNPTVILVYGASDKHMLCFVCLIPCMHILGFDYITTVYILPWNLLIRTEIETWTCWNTNQSISSQLWVEDEGRMPL